MSKVLVTGFGPYGVTPVNPAQLTAEELDGRTIVGATVISRIVPNTFFESIAQLSRPSQRSSQHW